MSIELNALFISELNEEFPRKNDLLKEGDDHIRLVKSILKNTLPNFNRPVSIAAEKLNRIDSMTEATDNTLTFSGNFQMKEGITTDLGKVVLKNAGKPVDAGDVVTKEYLENEGIGASWPVGSVFFTVDSRDPSEILKVGKWERFAQGRVIIGTGSDKDESGEAKLIALGGKGGRYNEKLEVAHLAQHGHGVGSVGVNIHGGGGHSHRVIANGHQASGFFPGSHGATSGGPFSTGTLSAEHGGDHAHGANLVGATEGTGGNTPHNNMMPWLGVHIWKRIE